MMTCLYLYCYIFCFQWGCQIKEICGQYALWDKESMITTNFWSGQHHTTLSTIIESWKQQQAWSYEAQVAPEIIDNASLFNHALGWHQANQPSSNNPIFGSQINIWTGRDRYWKITKDIFKSLLNQEKPVLYLLLLFCQRLVATAKRTIAKWMPRGLPILLFWNTNTNTKTNTNTNTDTNTNINTSKKNNGKVDAQGASQVPISSLWWI